jgi:SPP1 gp7 family putative phage head morphogenesis protein
MRVPVVTRRREQLRKSIEDEAIQTVAVALAKSIGDAGTAEKAFLTGNSAMMGNLGGGAAAQMSQGGANNALIARVTQNLAGGFGKAPEELEVALAQQGLSWGPPFPPGRPLDPFFGYNRAPRTWDYSVGENVQLTPRWDRVSFNTIKSVYESYDVAQICVRHLINDVRSLDYNWEPIPGIKADVSEDIEQAIAFFDSPDKRQPFRTWLAEWLQDVLRYDAGTLYIRRNEAGDPIALEVVSGTTIIPLVDFYGRRPEDETGTEEADDLFEGEIVPAFAQIIEGMPWVWLPADDLIYLPWNPLPDSQYGLAPLEAVLLSANTDIRFQWHFLQFFTEGTLPAGFMEAPPDQSDPNQIAHWQEVWDAVMVGDQSKLRQVRWVPNGAKFDAAKPDANNFDSEFPLYLMRRTCASFGCTPNDLGFTENVNKSSGDTQIDVQFRVGTSPLLRHAEDVINLFVKQHLKLRCRIHFDDGKETEDRVATATADGIYLDHGVKGVDEVRQDLGLHVDKSRPMPRYVNNTRSGPIPLLALESMAGKIDPETYGPSDQQQPVSTPFSTAPGPIPPQGSPEAINAAEHTAQNARDLVASTTGTPPPPVAEEDDAEGEGEGSDESAEKTLGWADVLALLDDIEKGADNAGGPGVTQGASKATTVTGGTDGITVATGIQGDGLDDDEDEEDAVKAAYVALSLRRWRDNSRNRLRKGRAPRRFVDPNLPADVHDAVWGKLQRASSREDVDAAFAAVGKASAASRAAFHSQADAIVAHYAPQVVDAIRDAFPNVTEAIEAAYAAVKPELQKDAARPLSNEEIASAAAASAKALRQAAKPAALKAVVTNLYGDSFLQGAHDAAVAAGSPVVASLKGVDASLPESYWGGWEPGHAEAAAKAVDGGMRDMLDAADQTIQGVNDTTIDRIGHTIAEGLQKGDSVSTTKQAVKDVISDPARAETIVNTEYARAMTSASMETYEQNGVEQLQWFAEGDACPECEENADASPIQTGDEWPNGDVPVHPNCRCAIAPVAELEDKS